MRNSLETRLGIFVALALVALAVILEMLGGLSPFKKGYELHALFKNIMELKVGDPVKMAGVQVGQVEKFAITNDQVRVTLRMKRDTEVRTDSKATVKFAGLMGQNYVSLDFGTNGVRAVDGAYLQTAEQPDLSVLMAKLDNVASGVQNITKTFTGDSINNLLGPMTDFIKQNSPALTATIGNLRVVSGQIADGKGTLGKLINDDALYVSALAAVTNLQASGGEIRQTIGQAQEIVAQINAGQGTLGKLVKDETLYHETTGVMTETREILQKINKGQGSVGKLINDDSLLKNVKLSLQKLDKATEGLEDTGPLSVVGTAVNSLF